MWNESKDAGKIRRQETRRYMRTFWERFLLEGKEARLTLLREYSDVTFMSFNGERLKARREKFNSKKLSLRILLDPCAVCKFPSNVRHHIVPLSQGGFNVSYNIIQLCHSCHAEIHPWLKKKISPRRLQLSSVDFGA